MKKLLGPLSTMALLLGAGCTPGEGERCNPLLFSDECGSGRLCTYPANCAVAYCCPVTGSSSFATCQACPGPDTPDSGAGPDTDGGAAPDGGARD